jgi:hypothetical protein
VIFLVATMFVSAIPLTKSVTALAAPTVSLPNSNWEKTDSTPYPETYAEHDPAGAGMLEYTDQTNYDLVRIYYEEAQVTSYTPSQLKTEAEDLFNRLDSDDDRSLDASGTANLAGVVAGYAEGYDSTEVTYKTEIVFVKGNYYFNVHAYYDATTQSESDVTSIIDSIDISGAANGTAFIGSLMFWTIVIAVAAVVVVVVVVVVVRSRKKKQPQQSATEYPYPPPPPPPPP